MNNEYPFMQMSYILSQKDRIIDYNNEAIRDWGNEMQYLYEQGEIKHGQAFNMSQYSRLGAMNRLNTFILLAIDDVEHQVKKTKLAMANDVYLQGKLHSFIINILNYHVFDGNDKLIDYLPRLSDTEKEGVDLRAETIYQMSHDKISFSISFTGYLFAYLENSIRRFDLSFNKLN